MVNGAIKPLILWSVVSFSLYMVFGCVLYLAIILPQPVFPCFVSVRLFHPVGGPVVSLCSTTS